MPDLPDFALDLDTVDLGIILTATAVISCLMTAGLLFGAWALWG